MIHLLWILKSEGSLVNGFCLIALGQDTNMMEHLVQVQLPFLPVIFELLFRSLGDHSIDFVANIRNAMTKITLSKMKFNVIAFAFKIEDFTC